MRGVMLPPCLYLKNDDRMSKVDAVEAVEVFFLKKNRPGVPRLADVRGRRLDAP